MIISKLEIENYKSFNNSGEINFDPSINVIVGKNNVGKTSFLQALSLQFEDRPHLSLKTVAHTSVIPIEKSLVKVSFEIERNELLHLLKTRLKEFYLPIDTKVNLDVPIRFNKFMEAISGKSTFNAEYTPHRFISAYQTNYGNFQRDDQVLHIKIEYSDSEPVLADNNYHSVGSEHCFAKAIATLFKERIYLFQAERLNIGESEVSASSLYSNASNLAGVLHWLRNNDEILYDKFVKSVRTVLPEVKHVTTHPNGNRANIRVWNDEVYTRRPDLALPLSESGSGVGQVLSMLYVVLTSEEPHTIIIDEPQSFLHPGAIRNLIQIFKQHNQHQYILTTHSPSIINWVNPAQILKVYKVEAESKVESIKFQETLKLQEFLKEIGASLSDVFGVDQVLWVEGPTEEECFPTILTKLLDLPYYDTAIVGIISTDELRSKDKTRILQIYKNLSAGRGLLPRALGFIFDRECDTENKMDDLKRESRQLNNKGEEIVYFLERRMYENYLLNPEAISAIMKEEGFPQEITPAQIEQWVNTDGWDQKYFCKDIKIQNLTENEKTPEFWVKNVHGSDILHGLFSHFSNQTHDYRGNKKSLGKKFTEWIIENSPKDLEDVSTMLKKITENN